MADYTLDGVERAIRNFEGVWNGRRRDYPRNTGFVRKVDGLLLKSRAIKRHIARIRKEDKEVDKVFFRLERQRRRRELSL